MSGVTGTPVSVGIIGTGVISDIYLTNLSNMFDNTRVVAVADLLMERAEAQAAKYGVDARTVDDLIASDDIELVVNLTIPKAHGSVAMQVVMSEKSVYNEKPLTATRDEGTALLARAKEHGVLVGGAPDTFLGGGYQTARHLIDDGAIGRPIAAVAHMFTHGHESWHPDPSFFYQPGAGPMLDMGPYYVTALVSLLGPVRRVSSSAGASFPERVVTSKPRAGEVIAVNTPTHISATLDFASGAIGTLITSFDLFDTTHSHVIIYGTEGSLKLPDPNTFGGKIEILQPAGFVAKRDPLSVGRTPDDKRDPNTVERPQWTELQLTRAYTSNSRGLGVSDLARAIREGGPARASGELAYHALDVMLSTLDSSAAGHHIALGSTVERPAPLSS